MKIELNEGAVQFSEGGKLFASYRLDDKFKPHFDLLCTPAGHNCVVVSPGDHRHHKGLMYALKCADVNFWEEEPDSEEEGCGVQIVENTELLTNGFRQELLWQELRGELQTYRETRTITLEHDAAAALYRWTWKSEREALRDHRLVFSPWASELEDGRKINYHGLGIRLPWMWSYAGDGEFSGHELDGESVTEAESQGAKGKSLGIWGLVDGHWNRTAASVTLKSDEPRNWYTMRAWLPYLATGPSAVRELDVSTGEKFSEVYTVEVADRPDRAAG